MLLLFSIITPCYNIAYYIKAQFYSLTALKGVFIHLNAYPADTGVFKTSSGRLKKVTTSYDQARLHHDVLQKTSILRCLKDVRFTTSWRCLVYVVLKTSDLRSFEDVWFTSSWRCPIYDVLKTPAKRRLCSNVVATSIRRKKYFFSYQIQKILKGSV